MLSSEIFLRKVGKNIRQFREKNGISTHTCAQLLKLRVDEYEEIEAGVTDITILQLIVVAGCIGVELNTLLGSADL